MTPELERYYNNYFDLFSSEGWKQLIGELTNNAVGLNNITGVKDELDLMFKKGQLDVLANLVNLEEIINNGFQQAQEDNEQEEDA